MIPQRGLRLTTCIFRLSYSGATVSGKAVKSLGVICKTSGGSLREYTANFPDVNQAEAGEDNGLFLNRIVSWSGSKRAKGHIPAVPESGFLQGGIAKCRPVKLFSTNSTIPRLKVLICMAGSLRIFGDRFKCKLPAGRLINSPTVQPCRLQHRHLFTLGIPPAAGDAG